MKAITVEPHKPDTARLEDFPEPDVRAGWCRGSHRRGRVWDRRRDRGGQVRLGASRETRLVLGHESLGRVVDPGSSSAFQKGDLVVGIVRRPDPVPCPNCAVGEWDMCRNGQYTERGIKEIDGFMSERWRIEPEYAIKVDRSLGLLGVLLSPLPLSRRRGSRCSPSASVPSGTADCARDRRRTDRPSCSPRRTTSRARDPRPGPRESGAKPDLVRALGATYHTGNIAGVGFEPDVIVECTGVGQVINDAIRGIAAGGVVCLTGVGAGGTTVGPAAADIAAAAVLKNNVVVGSVNANKRHWYRAGQALAHADRRGLRVSSRGGPPEAFMRALQRQPEDIKVVIQFAEA